MRRREFIGLLGGAAAIPLAARAQPSEGIRRIGALGSIDGNDVEAQARITAFESGLHKLGWTAGRDVRIDYRWAAGDASRIEPHAAELVALKPNAILAISPTALRALARQTREIPIVFVQVADPVGSGFVGSLARPGGNMTGFT